MTALFSTCCWHSPRCSYVSQNA